VPVDMNARFLGFFDMTQKNYALAILTGLTQFFQMKLALPPIKQNSLSVRSFKDDLARNMNIQMRYVMPIFVIFAASNFPSGLALYWTTMNIFAIVHESIVRNKTKETINQNGKTNSNNKIVNRDDS
jgi:membrane protein insertase Oxa1/YidC/SpoIIIJ